MIRRVTSKPWFGPKKYIGWGWRVTSWQGAVLLLISIGLLVADLVYMNNSLMSIAGAVVIAAAFIYIGLLTGDPPGGANSRSQSL